MAFSNNAPLNVGGSGQFSTATDGVCVIAKGPTIPGENWLVQRITVSTNSSTETTARIYRNFVGDQQFIDGTYSGNQDVSDENDILLRTGESLVIQWTGGTTPNGAAAGTLPTASLRLEGERQMRNRSL